MQMFEMQFSELRIGGSFCYRVYDDQNKDTYKEIWGIKKVDNKIRIEIFAVIIDGAIERVYNLNFSGKDKRIKFNPNKTVWV